MSTNVNIFNSYQTYETMAMLKALESWPLCEKEVNTWQLKSFKTRLDPKELWL